MADVIDLDDVIGGGGELDNVMYIFAYDVASENIKRLPEAQKRMLATKRSMIRHELHYRYGCALLQKSLWRVSEAAVEVVTKKSEEWLQWYSEKGFKAKMRVFPIGLNEAGYKTFIEMEYDTMMAWIAGLQESMAEYLTGGSINQKALNETTQKIQVIDSIAHDHFGPHSKDKDMTKFKVIADELKFLRDSVMRVQSQCKVEKY